MPAGEDQMLLVVSECCWKVFCLYNNFRINYDMLVDDSSLKRSEQTYLKNELHAIEQNIWKFH